MGWQQWHSTSASGRSEATEGYPVHPEVCESQASHLNETGVRPLLKGDAITGFDHCVIAGFVVLGVLLKLEPSGPPSQCLATLALFKATFRRRGQAIEKRGNLPGATQVLGRNMQANGQAH